MQPVVKTMVVRRSPEDAFRLFTAEIARWWPLATHHLSPAPPVACAVEPAVGGRIFETAADGSERDWGRVTIWQPPHRFAMAWTVNATEQEATEIVVDFTAAPAGAEIRLEHGGWERLEPSRGAARRAGYEAGWERVFVDGYGRLAVRVGLPAHDAAGPEEDESLPPAMDAEF